MAAIISGSMYALMNTATSPVKAMGRFRVSSFEFRVSGFEFRVSGFGFPVSGFASVSPVETIATFPLGAQVDSTLIFPLAVRGNGSSRTFTILMRLCTGSWRFSMSICRRTVSSETTAYTSACSSRVAPSPLTTASWMPGMHRSFSSSSSGATFLPEESTIVREARPVIHT